ncbi:MAG TPA: PorV/PorQ family protein [Desulfatiglandales bacterium]|nr:PorV/PorQ family protein [Desulfatiglandales bacterium]
MKLLRRIVFFIFVIIVINPFPLFGRGPGTSSVSFLRIDTGARPVGMGGVFCGIADDVNAIHYNPAGIIQLKRKEIIVTHNEWIEGIRTESLGYAHPVNKYWVLGLTLDYLYITGLVERDVYGNESGKTFGGNNGVLALALGRKLQDNISVGANFKIIREAVKDKNSLAYAMDIGFLYRLTKLKLGIAVQNLGTKIKLYEEAFSLPLNFKFGLGYKLIENMELGLDVNIPMDNEIDVRMGSEYWVASTIALRVGYKTNQEEHTGIGVSAGLGFRYRNYQIDYSFLPFGDLGNTHRISLNVKF